MDIRVLYAPEGDETLCFAAGELQRYLSRMLGGARGEAVFRLLVQPGEPGENDRFTIRIGAAGGEISGNSGRALLIGVYDYLRRLGCRFLGPGRQCECIPAISPEALPVDCTHRASFRHRGVCIEGADSLQNILDFIDWLPKAGYNAFFLQFRTPFAFLSRWYAHENNPLLAPEPYSFADAERDMREAQAALKKRGLLLHKVGHGWTGEALGYESLSWQADARPLPEPKRPLAAEVGGVRALYGGVPTNTNLCFSNPAAVDAFADCVVRYAKENPAVDYLHIWLADAFNNVCECGECQKSTPSDQYVAVLNEIDRRFTQQGLQTKLVFLLYLELLWPPISGRLQNPDRFVLMFAPISRTFERSYDLSGPGLPVPPYRRNRISLPAGLPENLAFLRGWQQAFSGDGFVYDYPLGRAHYGDFGYLHISRIIGGDIGQLHEMGLNGYISCQELRAGCPNFLPNYVMGRLLLDEAADTEAVIGEYLEAAYGGGAREAGEFLSALSRLGSCDYLNGQGARVNPDMARRMEKAAACCERFAPIAAAHAGDGLFWQLLGYHREYILRLAGAMRLLAEGSPEKARAAWEEMRSFICENEAEWQPYLDVYRVQEVTQNYTGFKPEKA